MTDVLVVGGGVAGSAVAYFAAQLGASVTVVDAGVHAASAVPSALVNPVRGQSGRVEPGALDAARLTLSLLRDVSARGFDVAHAADGVLRPVPDARTRERWQARLTPDLPHAWRAPGEVAGLAAGWESVLDVQVGGWLDGAAFTRALRDASGARVVRGWASELHASGVTLEGGERLEARQVVWCGGSVGTSRLGVPGVHRRGTLLRTAGPLPGPGARPLSFGVYAAPAHTGGVLGATFEAPEAGFSDRGPPLASLNWLLDGGARLLGGSCEVRGSWTGSRLSTRTVGRQPDGTWALAGLGSKGFLIGPWLARKLVMDEAFGLV